MVDLVLAGAAGFGFVCATPACAKLAYWRGAGRLTQWLAAAWIAACASVAAVSAFAVAGPAAAAAATAGSVAGIAALCILSQRHFRADTASRQTRGEHP